MLILPLLRFISPLPLLPWLADMIEDDASAIPDDALTSDNKAVIQEALATLRAQGQHRPVELAQCRAFFQKVRLHQNTHLGTEKAYFFPWLAMIESILIMEDLRVGIRDISTINWALPELEDTEMTFQEGVGLAMRLAMQAFTRLRAVDEGALTLADKTLHHYESQLAASLSVLQKEQLPLKIRAGFLAILSGWLHQYDYAWAQWEELHKAISDDHQEAQLWVRMNQAWLGFTLLTLPPSTQNGKLALALQKTIEKGKTTTKTPSYQMGVEKGSRRASKVTTETMLQLTNAIERAVSVDAMKALKDFNLIDMTVHKRNLMECLDHLKVKTWPLAIHLTKFAPFDPSHPKTFEYIQTLFEAHFYPEHGLITYLQAWVLNNNRQYVIEARQRKAAQWTASLAERFNTPEAHWLGALFKADLREDEFRDVLQQMELTPSILLGLTQTVLLRHDHPLWPVFLDTVNDPLCDRALDRLGAAVRLHLYLGAKHHQHKGMQKRIFLRSVRQRDDWAIGELRLVYLHNIAHIVALTLHKLSQTEVTNPDQPLLTMMVLQKHLQVLINLFVNTPQEQEAREVLYRHGGIEAAVQSVIKRAQKLSDHPDHRNAQYLAYQWLSAKAKLEGHLELAQELEQAAQKAHTPSEVACDITSLASWFGLSTDEILTDPQKFFDQVRQHGKEVVPFMVNQLKYTMNPSPVALLLAGMSKECFPYMTPAEQLCCIYMAGQGKVLSNDYLDKELHGCMRLLEAHPELADDFKTQLENLMQEGSLVACVFLAMGELLSWYQGKKTDVMTALKYTQRAMPVAPPSMLITSLIAFLQTMNLSDNPSLTSHIISRTSRLGYEARIKDFTELAEYLIDRQEIEQMTVKGWTKVAIKLAHQWLKRLRALPIDDLVEEWAMFVLLRHEVPFAEGELLALLQDAMQGIINKGNPDTCLTLAGLLFQDKRLPLDVPAMLAALEVAGVSNPNAKVILGAIYHQGRFVEQDKRLARHYWQEAADMGHKAAKEMLLDPDRIAVISPMHDN